MFLMCLIYGQVISPTNHTLPYKIENFDVLYHCGLNYSTRSTVCQVLIKFSFAHLKESVEKMCKAYGGE